MDRLTTFIVVLIAAAAVFVPVLAVAARDLRRHLRRGLDQAAARQEEALRRLSDGIAAMQQDLRNAEARIGTLSRANRKLTEQLAALSERVDGGPLSRNPGGDRVLH